MFKKISTTALLFIFSSSIFLLAQMPDWKFFKDRDGNGYYYDNTFKIRITDDKPFSYTPVTMQGVNYYFNKGVELIKEGKYSEGLFYLKSIKALPPDTLRVENNAKDSSKWINYLQKKHGTRYERFDKESTILLTYSNDEYIVINEKLRYKIRLKKQPHIIKASWKFNDTGYGLKFGFNLENNYEDNSYDCVTGIETRISRSRISSLSQAEMIWRYELGIDNFVRTESFRSEDRIIYLYTYGDNAPFSGIEGIFINDNMTHLLRVICSNSIKDNVFNEIKKPVEELVLVK
ncbi:MAG: hypothetical protein FWF73_04750 [Spirochaetes bacterium]|nr:hypothetical protein [Spirochaetota bacterium]